MGPVGVNFGIPLEQVIVQLPANLNVLMELASVDSPYERGHSVDGW